MAMKINVPKFGKRNQVMSALYRKVDTTGRVFLSTDLIGKNVLVLTCLPVYPNDLYISARQKTTITEDVALRIKVIEALREPSGYRRALNEGLNEEPSKEDYQFQETVIEEIINWIWGADQKPLPKWLDDPDDVFEETLEDTLLDEKTEKEVSIIHITTLWAREVLIHETLEVEEE